ncbi:MAG: uroporphyrinogen-III synthase [Paracoccaceae bacterium]
MTSHSPTILITRPAAQAKEFRKMLGAEAQVLLSPIIEIQVLKLSIDPGSYDAIVFASGNAVTAAAQSMELQGLNAVTVGDRTAQIAKRFGMAALSAKGSAKEMIATVLRAYPKGNVLFIHGRHTQGDVENKLRSGGVSVTSLVGYEQYSKPLSETAIELIGGKNIVILPLFSTRSAVLLSKAINCYPANAQICVIGISTEVVNAWTGPKPVRVLVAPEKTAVAMAKETLRQLSLGLET